MVYFSESQTLIKINFYVARNASCNRVGGPVYLCVAPTSSTRAASFLQIRRPLVSHFPSARDVAAGPENAPVNSPAPANGAPYNELSPDRHPRLHQACHAQRANVS